jgi:dTDP-4-amino-4,6-dideoxygalactose transaminase
MDAITAIAKQYRLAIVEDNAHGLFGRYKGKWLGTFGCLSSQSFHETKNVTCGEGGALLINDSSLIDRAEIIREKGTDRSRFFRGQVDKYSWVDLGSSYVMSDVLAAFLYAQLENWQEIQKRRQRIWEKYERDLEPWAAENDIRLPSVPSHCEQAYHMFYLLLPTFASRQALIEHLKARGITAVFHYLPLHLSAGARRFGTLSQSCPVTEDVSDRLLRLPFYNTLSDAEQERVIRTLVEFALSQLASR